MFDHLYKKVRFNLIKLMSGIKNCKNYLIVILVIIFLTPFVGVPLCQLNGNLCWFRLLDCGLALKDFFVIWINLWGVIGITVTIYINYKRLNNQDRHFRNQDRNFRNQNKHFCNLDKNEQQNKFFKSIELLSSLNESTRIGGCISLYDYALLNNKRDIIFNLFCSHIRSTTRQDSYKVNFKNKPSYEVQFILDLLFKKDKTEIYQFRNFRADLSESYLVGVDLESADIIGANFRKVDLSNSKLTDCDFKAGTFTNVELVDCELNRTIFDFSYFYDCNIEDIDNDSIFMNYCFIENSSFIHFECSEGSEFRGVFFKDVSFKDTVFFQANLIGVKFEKCTIESIEIDHCNITGIDKDSLNIVSKYLKSKIVKRIWCNKIYNIENYKSYLCLKVIENVERYNKIIKFHRDKEIVAEGGEEE